MSTIYNVQEQETVDAPAEQIAVDGSAGSDTDTGGPLKSDAASKDESDTSHHVRSNSVKKPTTFKAVSVTKNFLAKAGTPTAPAAKTNGDTGEIILPEILQTAADKPSPEHAHHRSSHASCTSTSTCRQDRKWNQGLSSQVLSHQF